MSGSFGPSIELTRLWAKTSQKTGATYFVGRLAGARITILPNRNKTDDNNHDMVILLSQADPPKPSAAQNGTPVLPFPAKPSPDQQETPPWEPQPAAAKPSYGRTFAARQPADKLKKRVSGGPRTQLVSDEVPF